jgi:hypothetical protein
MSVTDIASVPFFSSVVLGLPAECKTLFPALLIDV